jgi:periplasmic protein TonB
MKRNEKKVPGFDEIIFRNRNKEYGAYDLRRRYKSTASFSTLGVSAFFILVTFLIFSFMPKDATAGSGPVIIVSVAPEKYLNPEKIILPEVKRPANQPELPRYVPPKVVDDSINNSGTLMTNDHAAEIIKNGEVTENIDSVMKVIAPEPAKPEEIFFTSQEPPIFPGGPGALQKYIAESTKYPDEAIEINLQGKIIVKFAVLSDGSVSRIEIIRGISPILDQEAARVVSTLPKWRPGKQNGVPVSVWFTVPVTFQIK